MEDFEPKEPTVIDDIISGDPSPRNDIFLSLAASQSPSSDRLGETIVKERRRNFSETLSVEGVTQLEAIEQLKKAEDAVLDKWEESDVPDWLVRLDAQEMYMEYILQRIEEETDYERGSSEKDEQAEP